MKEKELIEVVLPNEVRRLKKIKMKVEREAAVDEIFTKNRNRELSFYVGIWISKYRRKALLRKLLVQEKGVDLEGYLA